MIDFNGLEYPWLFFVCVSRSHPDAAGAGAPTTIHRQMAVTLLASLAVHAVDTMERLASVGLGAMAIAILLVRLGETEFARFNGAFVTMLRYADAFCSGLVSSSMCVMLVVANQEEVAPILWTIYGVFCHVVLVVLTNRAPWHQIQHDFYLSCGVWLGGELWTFVPGFEGWQLWLIIWTFQWATWVVWTCFPFRCCQGGRSKVASKPGGYQQAATRDVDAIDLTEDSKHFEVGTA